MINIPHFAIFKNQFKSKQPQATSNQLEQSIQINNTCICAYILQLVLKKMNIATLIYDKVHGIISSICIKRSHVNNLCNEKF